MPGSGKSTFASILSQFHACYVSCDAIAHDILKEGRVINQLVDAFGKTILSGKEVDRKKLAEIAFESSASQLNQICHPHIREIVSKRIEKVVPLGSYFLVEVPLLFEAKFENLCSLTLNIVTPFAMRAKRVREQRGWEENYLKKRDSQQNEGLKRASSDINLRGDVAQNEWINIVRKIDIAVRYFIAFHDHNGLDCEGLVELIREQLTDQYII